MCVCVCVCVCVRVCVCVCVCVSVDVPYIRYGKCMHKVRYVYTRVHPYCFCYSFAAFR
jgi:hypothetical protein